MILLYELSFVSYASRLILGDFRHEATASDRNIIKVKVVSAHCQIIEIIACYVTCFMGGIITYVSCHHIY